MKNKFILPILLLTGILYLGSCGGSVTEDEIAEVEVREINKELDQLITNLAACEQQNTNCPAYTEASEGIEKLCSDEAARKEIVADLFYIIQTGPSARSQAGAHAVNFWTGSSDYKNDASYGRIVLEALKKESYDTDSYTGSQLGQLLSQWLVTSDKDLLADIVSAMKDKSVEMRGRSELIRLSSAESFAKIGVFDAVVAIVNNTKEEESLEVDFKSELVIKKNKRTSIAQLRPILNGYQRGNCFYCGLELDDSIEVDHVIPWTAINHDEIWNLVLAHVDCNHQKLAQLPPKPFVEKLIQRNEIVLKSDLPLKEELKKVLGDSAKKRMEQVWNQYKIAVNTGLTIWGGTDKFDPSNDDFYKSWIGNRNASFWERKFDKIQ